MGVMGNGALAGLVAITAGCSTIYPWGAVIVGFISGGLYVLGSVVSIKLHVRSLPCFIKICDVALSHMPEAAASWAIHTACAPCCHHKYIMHNAQV